MKETTTAVADVCVCNSCGTVIERERAIDFEGTVYCPDCAERYTFVCSHCGCRILTVENAGTDSHPLCQDCFDEYYTNCDNCGVMLHRDEAYYSDNEPYCLDCYSRRNRGGIEDYYYKPEPIFYGSGNRFFGVELEVDDAGEDSDNADTVSDIANYDGETRVYCKHDGSLDDGFEIVSHPMTLDYHEHKMQWEQMLDKLRDMGYLSHLASTCGLHVHVNRTSLGDTAEEREAVIARILFFFEKFWDELLKFSRRTSRQLDKWAARYGYKDHPKEMLEHVKKGTSIGRYYCVNLQNETTIEFRIFRGTLRYNTFIATLQFVDKICETALSLSDEEMRSLAWTTFAEHCTEPELVRYLKERRLYVNDPVDLAEEA